MTDLKGQVAIISGGLGDIGQAIAIELATCGADVAVGDVRDAQESEPLRIKLNELGRQLRYDRVDVSDSQAVHRWIEEIENDLGTPTLVIVNAAIVQLKGIRELSAEEWSRELSVNLDGAMYLAQGCAQRLLHHSIGGRIVFIGSWAAHRAHTTIPTYCVAKAGLRMLCKVMALDLAEANILVNEVAPGFVDGGLTGEIMKLHPDARQANTEQVPIRKLIEPSEVALQVANLCDPKNQHMTGSTLLMDGGLSLKSGRN